VLVPTQASESVESSGNSSDQIAGEGSEEEGESEEEGDEEVEPGYKMSRVCDRLIDVFWVEKPTPEDWRKLLAYSEEWGKICPHFFRRCEARAKDLEAADKPGKAAEVYPARQTPQRGTLLELDYRTARYSHKNFIGLNH